jgi:outer membrane cobalamin receptor
MPQKEEVDLEMANEYSRLRSNNTAVMINGVPVNGMEDGAVYWSNWLGLSDVTSAMQIQRGLGSSKLAIASVGGTVNIITSC